MADNMDAVQDNLQQDTGGGGKLGVKEFAAKIKDKYPAYANIDDSTLVQKIIDKYPVYTDQIDFGNEVSRRPADYPLPSKTGFAVKPNTGEPEPAKIDDPIELAKQANELSQKTVNQSAIGAPVGGFNNPLPDKEAIAQADKINNQLKENGYDPKQLNQLFGDIPEEWYNMPNFTKDKLLQGLKDNPLGTERYIAATKYQNNLLQGVETLPVDDGAKAAYRNVIVNSGKNVNYADKRRDNQILVDLTNRTIGDPEQREKVLSNIAADKSFSYGQQASNPSAFATDPLSKNLDSYQIAALNYIQDLSPEKYNTYKTALIDPETIKDNQDALLGREEKLKELEQIGIGLSSNYAQEKLAPIKKEYEGLVNLSQQRQLTPEELSRAKELEEQGKPLYDIIQRGQDEAQNLLTKYPSAGYLDADSFSQELLGQQHGFLAHTALEAGKATGNTVNGVWNFIKYPFLSDSQKQVNIAETLGNSKMNEHSTNLTQGNQMLQSFKPTLSPGLQTDIDRIKNDDSLTYDQKRKQVDYLLMTRPNEWQRTPIEGGKTNIGISSVMYGVGDLAANLAPFIALEGITGGGATAGLRRKFTSLFANAAATTFQDTYAHAIESGEPNPYQYAARVTGINAIAMAGADAPGAIRKLAAGQHTAIGDMISKLSDDEITSALRANPKEFSVLKKAFNIGKSAGSTIGQAAQSAGKVTAFTTGGQIINDAISGKLQKPEDYGKQALVSALNFTIFGAATGIAGKLNSKINDINKAALYTAGKDPQPILDALDQKVKNGSITPEDAQQVRSNVEKAQEVFKKVPFVNAKGNPLSEQNKRDLLFLKMQENDISEALKKDIPKELADKLGDRIVDIQDKMDKIYKGTLLENQSANNISKPVVAKEQKSENSNPVKPSEANTDNVSRETNEISNEAKPSTETTQKEPEKAITNEANTPAEETKVAGMGDEAGKSLNETEGKQEPSNLVENPKESLVTKEENKKEISSIGNDLDLKGGQKQIPFQFEKNEFENRIKRAIDGKKYYIEPNTKKDNHGRYSATLSQVGTDKVVGSTWIIPESKGDIYGKKEIINKAIPLITEQMHRDSVELAIKSGDFQKYIEDGKMTAKDAKTIIESAGLEVPKDIEDLASKEQTTEPQQQEQNSKATNTVEKNPNQLDQFKEVVNNSNSVDEAFDKVGKIKDVPPEVSQAFREKYDPENKLTPKQAFEKFYNEVKEVPKKSGKEIEPHPEVNTDFETVAKELKLSDAEKLVYNELKDVPKEEREEVLDNLKDNIRDNKDLENEIKQLQDEHDSIFDEMDEVDNSNKTKKQKDAAIKRLTNKQSKITKSIEDAKKQKSLKESDALFGFDENNANELIDKINSRIQTREGIKAGTDLFPAEANIPEIKLNKAEESLAKRKITNAGADKILKDGVTKETLEANKEVFDGTILKKEDLQKAKTYLDETGRPTAKPETDGQENTGNDGNKGLSDKGESIPRTEVKDATGENKPGTEAKKPSGEESLGKVAYARSNSYEVYKLLHPKETIEDYNKVRNSDVEIPTGDLRKLGKEYAKGMPNEEAAAQEKFYEEIAGSKPANTGRIPVSPIVGKAKDLSKIILDVSNSLNQKISFLKPGAGRRRALGTYSPGNAGIKIKFTGDLDVTAHEIGHSIDDNFAILKDLVKTPDAEIEKELNKFSGFGSKPPKGHPDPRKYKMGEGFAEWLRAYIVNPDEAVKQAPKIYELYKDKVSEPYQKGIADFSNDVRVWAGATGRDMVLSNIEWEPEKAKGLIKEIFSKRDNDMFSISFADKLAANWVNPMKAFEKAFNYARGIKGLDEVLPENDPTILARLFLSIDRKFGEFLEHGLRDAKDQLIVDKSNNSKTFKWLIEPLDNTDMATIKSEMQDVTSYMVAERTVELGKRFKREEILTGIGGGIYKDVKVAQKTLDEFNNGDPNRLKRIKEATKRYREFADDNLKYMVDKGRLSKENYDNIKENNLQYVALHRIMEAEPETEIQVFKAGSKKLSSVHEPIKSIKGSTKKIVNPYTSLLDSMYKSIKESDRNEVLKAFRDILVENRGMYEGDPKRLSEIGVPAKEGDKNTITIFVDGKPEKWAFQKDIYEALKGLDKEAYKVPSLVTLPATILRNMTTKFPTFALRNWVRDLQDRLIKSNDHSGVKDLFGNKEHWRDVARKGGLNSGYYVRDKAHYYGLMEQAIDEISKKQKTIFADPVKIKKLWHAYEDILQGAETSNRVAEYRAAFRQAKKKGMDDYNAGLYGAFKSRDLMDFAVAGHYMKVINRIIPFSNAAVQGLRSGVVRLKENPVGFVFRTALYSILPQAVLWWWNHRDDETAKQYEQLPYYQRDLFYNFKIGDNKWAAIPKPYELGMTGSGIDRSLSYYIAGDKNAFNGYAGNVFKSISPIDESVIGGPYQPIIGAISNYDMFRGKHIISPNEEGLNLSLRHTETASWLSQQIQKAAGIDARKLDYIIQSQFSYVGNEGLKVTDKVAELVSDHKAENKNKFDITDLGLFKRSPAYNAPVVQEMMEFAKEWRLDRSREYKEFKRIASQYFDTEDNSEKEEYSKQMIDLAKNLLDTWKAEGIGQKGNKEEKD